MGDTLGQQVSLDENWKAPIVIIGCGRSGSTLLTEILGAHPDINAVGETDFLLIRLWRTYFSKPNFVNSYRERALIVASHSEWADMTWVEWLQRKPGPLEPPNLDDLVATLRQEEQDRLIGLLGKFVMESLIPPKVQRKLWSFQEIWNGITNAQYGWDLHNRAFPEARYLHVVRHPKTWLPSYLSIRNEDASQEHCLAGLAEWVRINNMAARQRSMGARYKLIRYEDIVAYPKGNISSILSFVGVEDHPRCHRAMQYKYQEVQDKPVLPELSGQARGLIEGLDQLTEAYGYDLDW